MEELKKKARALLMTNPLLSPENREKWVGYVEQMTEEQLGKLIGVLEGSREDLKKFLQEKLTNEQKKELLEKLDAAKKEAISKIAEDIHVKEGKEAEEELEEGLNNL